MPLRRTPPPVSSPRNASTSQATEEMAPPNITNAEMTLIHQSSEVKIASEMIHYDSEPDLQLLKMNITDRKKRKFEGDDINSFMPTIKKMFESLSIEQNKRFQDLLGSVNSLRERNAELTKSVEAMSLKYDEFLSRIKSLEEARKEDKKQIISLEQKIENLERKTRSSSIEIRNIPKTNKETKTDLCQLIQVMGKSVSIDIKDSDIRDIYRITAKDSSNPIITEFTTVIMKEKVLSAVKNFNKCRQKGDKLNTGHLSIQGPNKPVFIAETLTQKSQRIFFLARAFAKEHGFAFCWTSRGAIYVRKSENLPQIRIQDEEDLEKLRNSI
ncbi:uncharacterized protein LOC113507810 [Trichoplusia ni]|uniref:Uncharacterized protein LOC113507810 n=1 Tax=Trichoplusia ni TaxID=7111 RepID=A0A7E5X243_TRINI|nr:uncharacterized protein LOC113507810 [Trichoplusia ni]